MKINQTKPNRSSMFNVLLTPRVLAKEKGAEI